MMTETKLVTLYTYHDDGTYSGVYTFRQLIGAPPPDMSDNSTHVKPMDPTPTEVPVWNGLSWALKPKEKYAKPKRKNNERS